MAVDPGGQPAVEVAEHHLGDDPCLDRVYGMLWYPLHGVGVIPNFYQHLWRGAFDAFPIPDTVLFRGNRPTVFFFSARGGDKVMEQGESPMARRGVCRKHARNVTSANVFAALSKAHFDRGVAGPPSDSRRRTPSPCAPALSGASPVCAVLMYESPGSSAGVGGPASRPSSGTSTPAHGASVVEGGPSRSVDTAPRVPGREEPARECDGTTNAFHLARCGRRPGPGDAGGRVAGRAGAWCVALPPVLLASTHPRPPSPPPPRAPPLTPPTTHRYHSSQQYSQRRPWICQPRVPAPVRVRVLDTSGAECVQYPEQPPPPPPFSCLWSLNPAARLVVARGVCMRMCATVCR
jgi:hypothetical protein